MVYDLVAGEKHTRNGGARCDFETFTVVQRMAGRLGAGQHTPARVAPAPSASGTSIVDRTSGTLEATRRAVSHGRGAGLSAEPAHHDALAGSRRPVRVLSRC